MNLLKSLLPIAAVAAGAYFGGGGGAVTGQRLATSFLDSQQRSREGTAPFQSAPVVRPTKLGQMNLGSKGSNIPVQMNPIQRIMGTEPRLESALSSLVNNATNQQVIDLFSKFGSIQYTAKGGKSQPIQQTGIQV